MRALHYEILDERETTPHSVAFLILWNRCISEWRIAQILGNSQLKPVDLAHPRQRLLSPDPQKPQGKYYIYDSVD